MSLYILDTDTVSLFQNKHPVVLQRVSAVSPSELAATIITVEEQLRGWFSLVRQSTRPDELGRAYDWFTAAMRFFSTIQILSFPVNAVQRFNSLKTLKLKIGKMDQCIAAIALEHGAVVVTRNV